MKKVFIPTVMILMAALYFGCAKKKTNVEFDIQYTSDVAIPTYSAAGQTYTIITNDISTMINDELAKNGTNADLVGEAKYTKFDIAIKTPTTATLDFIKQIRFYINAYQMPEQQAASRYNDPTTPIPAGAKTTTLNINDSNLKNRFMENSVYFKIKLMTYSVTVPTTITVTHKIHVKAISQ